MILLANAYCKLNKELIDMSNISTKKKSEINSKMTELRQYLKENFAPESIIQNLEDINEEIDNTKYGLVFEDHLEEIEELLIHKDTELVEQKELGIGNGHKFNYLIEGENLVALKHLEKTCVGKIDVIYIDPPYNTGMHSLNYSDHEYVDTEDLYIHSKWLSFIEKRIEIAYNLLSHNGVMFINIDENEIGTLLLLCGQIFDENNLDVLIWPKTDLRFDQNRVEKQIHNIKMVHEYILVCFKDKSQTNFNKILIPKLSDNGWMDSPQDMETIIKGLGTTSSAKDELAEIFGSRYRFQTPKPMRLIKELVRASSRKDSIVLDFFAGSGTTGHSVMDLNKEDEGNRRFILVTNNENGICRDITYERLKEAIENENYQESMKYYIPSLTVFTFT